MSTHFFEKHIKSNSGDFAGSMFSKWVFTLVGNQDWSKAGTVKDLDSLAHLVRHLQDIRAIFVSGFGKLLKLFQEQLLSTTKLQFSARAIPVWV